MPVDAQAAAVQVHLAADPAGQERLDEPPHWAVAEQAARGHPGQPGEAEPDARADDHAPYADADPAAHPGADPGAGGVPGRVPPGDAVGVRRDGHGPGRRALDDFPRDASALGVSRFFPNRLTMLFGKTVG